MRILITGVSARALAESACRAGWTQRIVAVDYFGDWDLQRSCENYSLRRDARCRYSVRRLLEACRRFQWDTVVYTANLENYPNAVSRLAAAGHLLGNSATTLAEARNPQRFLDCLRRAGVPVPRMHPSPPAGRLARAVLEKPRRGGGGQGIAVVSSRARRRRGTYLQEYVPGLPCGVAFVADGSRATLLGVSQQLIGDAAFGAKGFQYCGSLLGKDLPGLSSFNPLLSRLEEIVNHLTSTFHLVGVNGMDFILNEGEIYPLEINPRYTASMELIEMAYGLNMFSIHLEACHGSLPAFDLRAAPDISCAKAILFAERAAIAPATEGWLDRGIRDIPFPGERIRAAGPICTLLVSGPSLEACYLNLVEKAEELKAKIYA
ncbi:MAG: ATP-grasp domain-containing protein [Candidatus Methylomirabilales bacterium]